MKNWASCDVLVAGGGIAGVSAALAAARNGSKVILLEKTITLGGLATNGLINIFLPLCDGHGKQVTFGIAEELLVACMKYGPGEIPKDWPVPTSSSRLMVYFSPASFVLAVDELLEDAGVEVWLDTMVIGTAVEQKRVVGLNVANKSGCGQISAGYVVDATGDADVARLAGVKCGQQANQLSIWALEISAKQQLCQNSRSKFFDVVRLDGKSGYCGITGRNVSDFALGGRKMLRQYYQKKQLSSKDRNTIFPITLPAMAQLRTTQYIEGQYTLQNSDYGKTFDDCVGLIADWRTSGQVWQVPLRALLPVEVEGLITAGRCIAAKDDAWEVMRVIPTAAMTGEIAGLTSSICVKENAQKIEPPQIQTLKKELKKNNFLLKLSEK